MFQANVIIHDSKPEILKYIETFLIKSNIHKIDRLDLTNIDAIGIDDIRRLISLLQLRPFASRRKAVILEAEPLSLEAQQALLKTIEEPPEDSFIFIAAQSVEQLLPTFLSRTAVIYLKNIPTPDTKTTALREFWSSLLGMNPIRRMFFTADYTDRTYLVSWLTQQIIFLRDVLISKYGLKPQLDISKSELILLIKILETTLLRTKQNVNTKLLVDALFLNIPWVKTSTIQG